MPSDIKSKTASQSRLSQDEMHDQKLNIEPQKNESKSKKILVTETNSFSRTIDNDAVHTNSKTKNGSPLSTLPPPGSSGTSQKDIAKNEIILQIEVKQPETNQDNADLLDALKSYRHAISQFSKKEAVSPPNTSVFGPNPTPVEFSLRKANFILAAIHDETSLGSWNFANQISRAISTLQGKIDSKTIYRASELSGPFLASLKSELNESKEKMDYLQQTRSSLITLRSNWAKQQSMTALQQTATRHLALSIVSRAQLGQSALVPLDFLSKDGVGNHSMILSVEPSLDKNGVTDKLKLNIYETNGDMSEKIIPYKEWADKVKENKSKIMQSEMFPGAKQVFGAENFVSPRAKSFTKTEIVTTLNPASNLKASEGNQQLPPIVAELGRWMTLDYPPNPKTVSEQIDSLRKELSQLYGLTIPDQELQSIQRHGVCELKSIYSYLKRNLSPIAYALVRHEIISSARDIMMSSSDENPSEVTTNVISTVVKEAAAKRVQKSEGNSIKDFHAAVLKELIDQADSKLTRANKRLSEYIDAILMATP